MSQSLGRSLRWLAVAAAAGISVTVSADGPSAFHGVRLMVAGRSNATPTIAALNRFVAVAWGATPPGGAADVYAVISRDGGRTFASPVRVNDVPGDASIGGEEPPQVALVPRAGREPDVLVLWTAKGNTGTRLLTARSANGGASFERATPINASLASGNRGWESLAIDRDGHAVAVWLDHRGLASSGSSTAMHHEGHDHAASALAGPKADGAVRAQLSTLHFARVEDPASAQAITGGVCYCCKTAVATAPDGSIYAGWRHVYPGNLRDIAFTASRDGGHTFSTPTRVSEDGWALDGCPENGPTLAVGVRGVVHVVWPTLVRGSRADDEPSLALFHAATSDGRQFSARQRLPTHGTPRHPQMIGKADGSLVIVWDEDLGGGRRVVAVSAAERDSTPLRFTPRPIDEEEARSEYPVVAVVADATLIAWVSGDAGHSVIHVQRIP